MASETFSGEVTDAAGGSAVPNLTAFGPILRWLLAPLASLKLTVALFAMSIFIVFAGFLMVEKFGYTVGQITLLFLSKVWTQLHMSVIFFTSNVSQFQ